jgi:hypothetical protein
MGMKMRIAVRGFAGKRKVFDERVDIDPDVTEAILALATSHASRLMNYAQHMVEIEFLDETNENERFFRFGTDPSGMVKPIVWKDRY